MRNCNKTVEYCEIYDPEKFFSSILNSNHNYFNHSATYFYKIDQSGEFRVVNFNTGSVSHFESLHQLKDWRCNSTNKMQAATVSSNK